MLRHVKKIFVTKKIVTRLYNRCYDMEETPPIRKPPQKKIAKSSASVVNTADKVSSHFCVTCCAVLCYAWKRVIQIPTFTVFLLKNIHKCNIPTELLKQAKAPEVLRSADISRLIICRVLVTESAVTTILVSTRCPLVSNTRTAKRSFFTIWEYNPFTACSLFK